MNDEDKHLLYRYHQIAQNGQATNGEVLDMLRIADQLETCGWSWQEQTDTWRKRERSANCDISITYRHKSATE